jgi:hypothetical protein
MKGRVTLLVLALLAAVAFAGAVRSAAQGASATLPSSFVVWDGTLKVTVGCTLQSGSCTGSLSVRAPGASEPDDLAAGDYSVAAGATTIVRLDPGGSASRQLNALRSVVVRIVPSMGQGDPFEATLGVKRPAKSRKHRRYFTFLGGTEKNTEVLWQGELSTHENRTAACVRHKLVKIQKKVGRRWVTVARTRTAATTRPAHPGSSASYSKLLPLDPAHLFRALAPRVRVRGQICLKAASRAVHAGQ